MTCRRQRRSSKPRQHDREGSNTISEEINPYSPPLPTEEQLRGKTPAEQDKLASDMRSEWARTKDLELERLDQRRGWIAGGGNGEDFDRRWQEGGESEHIRRTAKERQETARRESSIF